MQAQLGPIFQSYRGARHKPSYNGLLLIAILALVAISPIDTGRGAFYMALAQVHDGMSPAQVEQLLGRPDDTRTHEELGGIVADSMWCYGTDRHLGMATLGHVFFKGGKVWGFFSNGAPFKQLMPEADLQRIMRQLYQGSERRTPRYDPLWVIRSVNMLIPLGIDKVCFAIEQYGRVLGGYVYGDQDLFWALRTLFEPPDPPGFMPVPMIGAIYPTPPKDLRKSPRFPMEIVDDVPFNLLRGVSMAGVPESPFWALSYYRKYKLRTNPLVPPNDPFLAYEKLLKSKEWPWPGHTKAEDRFTIPYEEDEGFALKQVLMMVRRVYQPVDFRVPTGVNGLDFPKFHKGFLALGVRWDPVLQQYVRADGKTLADKKNPPEVTWKPKDMNNMHVTASLQRLAELDYVTLGFTAEDKAATSFLPEVLSVYDAASNELLACIPVDGRDLSNDSVFNGKAEGASARAKYLLLPALKLQRMVHSKGLGVNLAKGRRVRLELATRKEVQTSPIVNP